MPKTFRFFKWSGKKAVAFLVLTIVLATAFVGATVAFIIDITNSLTNTFAPAEVKIEISGDTISNTGDADAYVRAAVVVTWVSEADDTTLSTMPKEGTDYTVAFNTAEGWVQGVDGFWYQTEVLAPGEEAPTLINAITQTTTMTGYKLTVQVLSSAIQATPADAVTNSWTAVSGIENGVLQITKPITQ